MRAPSAKAAIARVVLRVRDLEFEHSQATSVWDIAASRKSERVGDGGR